MNSPSPLVPTYIGIIHSTHDALVLFECCLNGIVTHVPRRPHDRERESVIKSGQVFIYEEHSSGIKRWTDGISWSPSRILGNFLIYRQLVRSFPTGEKKKAIKKPKPSAGVVKNTGSSRKNSIYGDINSHASGGASASPPLTAEQERALIGSLTDSYDFLDEGLVKKTISITFQGTTHHLVSYYTVADAMSGSLNTPRTDPRFRHVTIRDDLLNQAFRSPIDDSPEPPVEQSSYSRPGGYGMTNQSLLLGNPTQMMPLNYPPSTGAYGQVYGAPVTSGAYENGLPSYAYSNSQYPPAPGVYQVSQPWENSRRGFDHSASSDGNRAQIPSYSANRRGSAYHTSQDSGISMSIDRAVGGDSSISQGQSTNNYYPPPQANSTSAMQTMNHLPPVDFSRSHGYDRAATAVRPAVDPRDGGPWMPTGNNGGPHAHWQHHWPNPNQ